MAEIKSALELALERTKDIKSDPEALRRHEARETGKRLFAQLVKDPGFDLKNALKETPKEQRSWVREGLFSVVKSNITLPQTEADLDRVAVMETALAELVGDRGALKELLKQVRQFFQQYLDDRKQIFDSVRRQYEPRIKQKEQQLAQQYGRPVKLDPASDPEYTRAIQDHLEQLDGQYRKVLQQVNEHIQTLYRE